MCGWVCLFMCVPAGCVCAGPTDPCDLVNRGCPLVCLRRGKLHSRCLWTCLQQEDRRRRESLLFSLVIPRSAACCLPLTRRPAKAPVPVPVPGLVPGLVVGRGGALASGFDHAVHGSVPEIVVIVMGGRRSPEGSSATQTVKSGDRKWRTSLSWKQRC